MLKAVVALAAAVGITIGANSGAGVAQQPATPPPLPTIPPAEVCQVPMQAGWHLVSLQGDEPISNHILGASGPLYTWQAGDTEYEVIAEGMPLKRDLGYWAYYPVPALREIVLSPSAIIGGHRTPQPVRTGARVPVHQWVLIGNSTGVSLNVESGAEASYIYDPAQGYVHSGMEPGGALWVYGQIDIVVLIQGASVSCSLLR